MDFMEQLLPILIYVLLIVLLILLIIISIRVIKILKRVDNIVDNVDDKVNSLNGVFHIIDNVADGMALFSDKILDYITNVARRLFKKKKNKTVEEESLENEEG